LGPEIAELAKTSYHVDLLLGLLEDDMNVDAGAAAAGDDYTADVVAENDDFVAAVDTAADYQEIDVGTDYD
jgi:hypothetical protein